MAGVFVMTQRIGIVTLFVLALVVLAVAPRLLAASLPAVGSVAPEFTLTSQEGKPVSLKDYHGKWVVLYFYPKDFTSGCTMEAHNFQRDQAQYQQKGVVKLASRHTFIINPEGKIAKVYEDVNPAKHSEEVLAALTELQK